MRFVDRFANYMGLEHGFKSQEELRRIPDMRHDAIDRYLERQSSVIGASMAFGVITVYGVALAVYLATR